jgi:putative ABC transport system permease protein
VILNGKIGGQEITWAATPPKMGPTLPDEFPEVEDFLRMTGGVQTIIEYNKQSFIEENLIQADSSFFNFFSVKVLRGDPKNLLNAPRKAVLSESTAKRIFGSGNPVDKTLKIGSDSIRYTVSGVMEDIPGNSHFEANILTSYMTNPGSDDPNWLNNCLCTYILLKHNTSFLSVN